MYVLYIHPNNTETVMYAHFINKFLSTHITQQSLVKYVSATGPISSSHLFFGYVWRHVPVQDYLFVVLKV